MRGAEEQERYESEAVVIALSTTLNQVIGSLKLWKKLTIHVLVLLPLLTHLLVHRPMLLTPPYS